MSSSDSQRGHKTGRALQFRQSDQRRVAQLRETGVTPEIFRSALRSDRSPRPATQLPEHERKVVAPTSPAVKIKQDPVVPEAAIQGVSLDDDFKDVKKEEKELVNFTPSNPAGRDPSVEFIDMDEINDILAQRTRTDLQRGLQCFLPNQWLNDDVVDQILESFASRNPLFGRVSSTDITGVQRSQTERAVRLSRARFGFLATRELWLAPLCHDSHWVLFVGRGTERIDFYDSLLGSGYKQRMTELLHHFLRRVWGDDVALPQPRTIHCPQQPNGTDCGLHVIRNADLATSPDRPANKIPPLLPVPLRAYYQAMYERLLD